MTRSTESEQLNIAKKDTQYNKQQKVKVFKISASTLKKWAKKYDETREIKDKQLNRTFKKIDPTKLEKYLAENPDAYLLEIAKIFHCSDVAVIKALRRLKITRKKDKTLQGAKPD